MQLVHGISQGTVPSDTRLPITAVAVARSLVHVELILPYDLGFWMKDNLRTEFLDVVLTLPPPSI